MTEEFLAVVNLDESTTYKDIEEGVFKFVNTHQLNLRNLIGIGTGGAPSMTEKNSGAVNLILRHRSIESTSKLRKGDVYMPMFFAPGKLVRTSSGYVPRYDRCSQNSYCDIT